MSTFKIYNKITIATLGLTLIFIVLLNYLVNPYNIFEQRIYKNTFLKAESKIQERLTKPIGLKLRKNIDTIFMGSSRVDLCFNTNDYYDLTKRTAENIAIGGLKYDELKSMIDIAIKTHPEIKKIYIGIDFQLFDKIISTINDNRVEITKNTKLESKEINSALLSVSTTGITFWTIIKNILKIENRMYYPQGHKYIYVNKEIQQEFDASLIEYNQRYINYKLDYKNINDFSKYINNLKKQGITVHLFIMPTHITIQNQIDETGKRNIYKIWQREMSKIGDIYDFNIKNEYTTEEIKPDMQYFFDGSHATHKFGRIIIEDLLSKNPKYAKIIKQTY